jgi:putative cell wall-binding protein
MKTMLKILITLIISLLMIGSVSAQEVTFNNIWFNLPDGLNVSGGHQLNFKDYSLFFTDLTGADGIWSIGVPTDSYYLAKGDYKYRYAQGNNNIWYSLYNVSDYQSVILSSEIDVFGHPYGVTVLHPGDFAP